MPHETSLPDGYLISDDPARLDISLIHRFIAASYWAPGRPRELVERSIAGSLCMGLYGPAGQAGFARVVTDRTLLAWLCDVFVLPEARGRGLGKALIGATLDHPELRGVRRWVLLTRDAHALYARFGFAPLDDPAPVMVRTRR